MLTQKCSPICSEKKPVLNEQGARVADGQNAWFSPQDISKQRVSKALHWPAGSLAATVHETQTHAQPSQRWGRGCWPRLEHSAQWSHPVLLGVGGWLSTHPCQWEHAQSPLPFHRKGTWPCVCRKPSHTSSCEKNPPTTGYGGRRLGPDSS